MINNLTALCIIVLGLVFWYAFHKIFIVFYSGKLLTSLMIEIIISILFSSLVVTIGLKYWYIISLLVLIIGIGMTVSKGNKSYAILFSILAVLIAIMGINQGKINKNKEEEKEWQTQASDYENYVDVTSDDIKSLRETGIVLDEYYVLQDDYVFLTLKLSEKEGESVMKSYSSDNEELIDGEWVRIDWHNKTPENGLRGSIKTVGGRYFGVFFEDGRKCLIDNITEKGFLIHMNTEDINYEDIGISNAALTYYGKNEPSIPMNILEDMEKQDNSTKEDDFSYSSNNQDYSSDFDDRICGYYEGAGEEDVMLNAKIVSKQGKYYLNLYGTMIMDGVAKTNRCEDLELQGNMENCHAIDGLTDLEIIFDDLDTFYVYGDQYSGKYTRGVDDGGNNGYDAGEDYYNAMDDPNGMIISYSNSALLGEEDLSSFSAQELTYARNEIYARHGYVFKSDELNRYFNSKNWYIPNPGFDGNMSSIEKKNAEFIKSYQDQYGLTYTPN